MPELTLENFNLLCLKADARDRMGMFCQYAARVVMGLVSLAAPTSGSRLFRLEELSRAIWTNLSAARRTQRWCKELPVLQGLPGSLALADPVDRALEVAQKVSLAAFFVIDHIGGLKQWRVLPGGKRSGMGTIILGLKVLLFSCAVGAVAQVRKLCKENTQKWEDKKKCIEGAVKSLLLGAICAHLSSACVMHDVACGVAGLGYSSLELRGHWATLRPISPPKTAKVATKEPKMAPQEPKMIICAPKAM